MNTTESNTIGSNLRAALKRKDVSQAELTDVLQTDKSLVSKWCHDRVRPGSDNLRKIAEYLHISVDEIIYGPDAQKNNPLQDQINELENDLLEILTKLQKLKETV